MAIALFMGVTQIDAAGIHRAAVRSDLDGIKQELNNGVSIDSVGNYGDTALNLAALNGRTEIVNYLLTNGAKVNIANRGGRTALMMAASNGHKEIVNALLPHLQVDDVLARDKKGENALDQAKCEDIKQSIQNHIDNEAFKPRGMRTKSAAKTAS